MTDTKTSAPAGSAADHHDHEHGDACGCGHDHHHHHGHHHAPIAPYRAASKVGRNDVCPCGSGRKFKKCCLEHVRP